MAKEKEPKPPKKKKQPTGTKWQKGQSGNPAGLNGKNPIVSAQRRMSRERLMEAIMKVMPMPQDEVEALSVNPSSRACDALIASVMTKGIKSGNPMHAQFFMSYTFGRPLEYDPKDEDQTEVAAEGLKGVPKDLIVGVLRAINSVNQPVAIPAST